MVFIAVNAFKQINVIVKNNFKFYKKFKMVNLNYEDEFNKFYEENFDKNYDNLNKIFENDFNRYIQDNFNETSNSSLSNYIIIWDSSIKSDMLLYDMYLYNLNATLYERNKFGKKNLDRIYNKYIKNIQFFDSDEPWIFKNGEFIGGIFELYELFFYL
jgi:hypothetical protein